MVLKYEVLTNGVMLTHGVPLKRLMNRQSADAEIANGSENADVSLDGVKGSSNGNEDAVSKESKDAARALPLWLADATPNDFTVGDWLT